MKINPDDVTVLMGGDAQLTGGLEELNPGTHAKRFWVHNWRSTDDLFAWTVEAPADGDYEVAMIACSHPKIMRGSKGRSSPVEVELAAGASRLTHRIAYRDTTPCTQWDRERFEGLLRLCGGTNTITLRAVEPPEEGEICLALFSLELVRPEVRIEQDQAAAALRSSTEWMANAGYGMFFHWNSSSMPLRGPAKPYADAVRDFDVEKFADMVAQTGASFIVLTTSWAQYYFPAPISAIDRLLPGRTTARDLPGELAEALGRHGIRLILYYHRGDGDPPWWSKQGCDKEDKSEFFGHWCDIISEVGERYGPRLAGFWVDDASLGYYPTNAPWQQLTQTAKAGNPDRVVGYNCWALPKPTDFQDFYTGEIGLDEADRVSFLPVGGTGRYTDGPQAGLQASFCGTMEPGDWTHTQPDTNLPDPHFTLERMATVYRDAISRRNVPIMNMLISQDGDLSPATLRLFTGLRKQIKGC